MKFGEQVRRYLILVWKIIKNQHKKIEVCPGRVAQMAEASSPHIKVALVRSLVRAHTRGNQ